ncbi:terminase TerL endonuclease subunit [Oenococcus oeni]|uniref:Terminase large subunit n=11 Tax=Oenococcus oeni TaxID=1247 RepID=D3LC69_OENOE|nr:terminase TerL endonuclease subunit [Oenococcus oeni]EFD87516.1 hypothetical protein AWRIB429_1949 [Oenococcus oeni AWRIB429]EJO04111.1 phage terminase large subunit [Oenococcus oeni AWRIB548]EJO04158.1 phage terminase large subunit [Oenococcus oeni AWRIB548]EJO10516.1 phage terminase large subunit [Oenococcus oeni AWRIB576]EJO11265.1 phage terminase large subunit [Oenococcus oeni AWRIB568]
MRKIRIDLTKTHDVIGAYKSIDFSQIRKDYQDPGTKYAFDVLDGKYITGYYMKLACFRHLRDLQRQDTKDFPYHYSIDEVKAILNFAAQCPEVKTLKPVKLMPFQEFSLVQLIGWRSEGGDKRFARAIISEARHQGKTYLMAIIIIYSFLIESLGQSSQDYLVTSKNFKQTSKILSYVKTMLRLILNREPWKSLGKEDGINLKSLATQSDMVVMSEHDNKLRAITWDSGQYDGFHFKTAIGDEFADPAISDVDKISKITSGQIDVDNKQFIQISTAYPDSTVPFHRDEKHIIESMEKDWKRDGDTYLCLIWAIDNISETEKPEMWIKANPLLDMPEKHDKMLRDLKTEKDADSLAGNLFAFQNKSLNIWLQASIDSYLSLKNVEESITPKFDMHNREVYIGFDYSQFSDNTAFGFVFPYFDRKGQPKFFLYQHSFIPWNHSGSIENKERQDGIDYRTLEKMGFCTITEHKDGIINTDQVYQWLTKFVFQYQLKVLYFGYDEAGSYQTANLKDALLANYPAWNIENIKQWPSNLAKPTKYLQDMFTTHKVTRLDDEVMEKALLNATTGLSPFGISVEKNRATLKIDVVDALIDAFYKGMYHFDEYSEFNSDLAKFSRMDEQEQLKKGIANGAIDPEFLDDI